MGASYLILTLLAATAQTQTTTDTTAPQDSSLVRADAAEPATVRRPARVPPASAGRSPVRFGAFPDSLPEQAAHGIAYERLSDAFRYDRVQGFSLGLGYRVAVPGVPFTGLHGTVRYGFSDDRVTGRLSVVRDAPEGRLTVSGARDIVNLDPFAPSPGIGPTLNALFVAHDDGDYVLIHGASADYQASLGGGILLAGAVRYERQFSASREAASDVNDFFGGSGEFPPNPPVDEGDFVGAQVRASGVGRFRWQASAEVLGGEGTTTGRIHGEVRRGIGGRSGLTLRVKAGLATSPTLRQMAFRLGGIGTVRGQDYGARRGQAFWAAQVDVAPIPGRLRPVAFLDAGQADRAGDLFSGRVLAGAGVGLSVYGGLLRLDLSRSLSPDLARLRFDVVVQAAR